LTEEITELPARNTVNDQTSSTNRSSETIVATVRGTEMVRAASTMRQADTSNFGTQIEETDETSSISSASSATSDASKPEQR
jgi:hypothetical protein